MRGGGDSEFAVPGKLALGSPPPSCQSVQIASRPSSLDLGFDNYMRNKEEDKNEKSKKLEQMRTGIHENNRLECNHPSSFFNHPVCPNSSLCSHFRIRN